MAQQHSQRELADSFKPTVYLGAIKLGTHKTQKTPDGESLEIWCVVSIKPLKAKSGWQARATTAPVKQYRTSPRSKGGTGEMNISQEAAAYFNEYQIVQPWQRRVYCGHDASLATKTMVARMIHLAIIEGRLSAYTYPKSDVDRPRLIDADFFKQAVTKRVQNGDDRVETLRFNVRMRRPREVVQAERGDGGGSTGSGASAGWAKRKIAIYRLHSMIETNGSKECEKERSEEMVQNTFNRTHPAGQAKGSRECEWYFRV